MPDALCAVSPQRSTLVEPVTGRPPKFLCTERSDLLLFLKLRRDPQAVKRACTVMHEAIVAQLHPQDQGLLPRPAVALHQETEDRDRVDAEE